MKINIKKLSVVILMTLTLLIIMSTAAMAQGSGMPWEDRLTKILDSITGPVAKVIGALAIVLTGLGMAFGEGGDGVKRLLQIAFGLSIAFTAVTFFLPFFGFGNGLAF